MAIVLVFVLINRARCGFGPVGMALAIAYPGYFMNEC
jgi:hypothetical protein